MNIIGKSLMALFICSFSQSYAEAIELENNISKEQLAYDGALIDSIEIHSPTEATIKDIKIRWGREIYRISASSKADSICTRLGFEEAVGKAKVVANDMGNTVLDLNIYGVINDEVESDKIVKDIKCRMEVLNPLIERNGTLFSSFYTMDRLVSINKNFVRWMLPLRKEHKTSIAVNPISQIDPFIGVAATDITLSSIEIPYRVSITVLQKVIAQLGVSIDSYNLILCHEVSHHEKNFEEMLKGGNISSNTSENESDWKSLDHCWEYLSHKDGLKYLSTVELSNDVIMYCDKNHPSKNENDICKRVSLAASSLVQKLEKNKTGKITASLNKEAVNSEKSDGMHASSQCRLDILKTKMSCLLNQTSECVKPKCFDM